MLQVVSSRPGRDKSQKWWFPPVLTPKDYTKQNCNPSGDGEKKYIYWKVEEKKLYLLIWFRYQRS